MNNQKSKFALFFGHGGPFPAQVVKEAMRELPEILKKAGHEFIMLSEDQMSLEGKFGIGDDHGQMYANWLVQHKGEFDGVILSLPNFGDENIAVQALKDAGVPILIQAYPDEIDKMKPDLRRDSFCGKFSIMDVFWQYKVPFTALKPHVVDPKSDRFKDNLDYFDRMCRVVKGFKGLVVGAIGARSTPFKTVRIDEITLQQHGIEVVTLDLCDVFDKIRALSTSDKKYKEKASVIRDVSNWKNAPDSSFESMIKLGVILDELIEQYNMDAIALRCWTDLQQQFSISPCVLMGELNDRGIAAACEVDLGNAIAMKALSLASYNAACCLDWNNNYGDDDDKCIIFHCGPVPSSLMAGKGQIVDHPMLGRMIGMEKGYGCNVGRIAPSEMTFGSISTNMGKVRVYLGEGEITKDEIPADFFGCPGVAHIPNSQDVFQHIGQNGYRHHVSMTSGKILAPVKEAFEKYLGFEVAVPQNL